MRVFLITFFATCFFGCNTSSKKDPNQVKDDTARMRNPSTTAVNISIAPVKIIAADIPSSIKVKGNIREVWKWTDKLGENILITSSIPPYDDKSKNEYDEEGQTAELYAYHYAKKEGDEYKQIWTISDAEKSCPFDITCGFIPGSITITDLNKNGIAETKVQYSIACRSDVSPSAMKLIMHENGTKYQLKGTMWLAYSPELKYQVTERDVNLEKLPKLKDESEELLRTFGRYETEKDFTNEPSGFISFARSEWLKYSKEKMGE